MNRIRLEACLIAAAAIGCSSSPPPREIPPPLYTGTAETLPARQRRVFTALPIAETSSGVLEADPRDQDLSGQEMVQAQATAQTARQEYETLSVLPEAESRVLRFHLDSQTFDYFEDGELLLSGPIASGNVSSPTPTGKFSILGKERDKESSRYTNEIGTPAWMPYSMQFSGNYFIHEGWLPGYPASHGCIRIGHNHAKLLFERMKVGDRVTVSN